MWLMYIQTCTHMYMYMPMYMPMHILRYTLQELLDAGYVDGLKEAGYGIVEVGHAAIMHMEAHVLNSLILSTRLTYLTHWY